MSRGRTSTRKALSQSLAQTCITVAFSIATVTIVSRLLTPAEIGVFSVAVALVTLVHMLRDFGVSELIVQEEHLSQEVVRTAFTVNLVIAWVLAIVVFGLSGPIGEFYRDPGVTRVVRVLSLVFVLMPFGTTTKASMKREMQFGVLVWIGVAQTAARGISMIVLAWLGFSYMSMAWAAVADTLVATAGYVIWGGKYRVRGLGLAQWQRVLHFASSRTIADIVSQLGAQSAQIVVGRVLGMAPAGLYSRGYSVVNLFQTRIVGGISRVAFPAYAREHRETNTAPLLYRKSLVYLTGICWPFFAFCTVMAFPVLRIAVGSQWDAAVPLMRWLCGAAIVATLVYQSGSFLTAIGCYRLVTRIEVQCQLARIVLTVLAVFYSLEAVAAVQVVVYVISVVLYYRNLTTYDALSLRSLVANLAPSAALTAFSIIVPVGVVLFWPGHISNHYVPAFLVSAAGAAVAWLGGLYGLRHPLTVEIEKGWAALRRLLRPVPDAG